MPVWLVIQHHCQNIRISLQAKVTAAEGEDPSASSYFNLNISIFCTFLGTGKRLDPCNVVLVS